MKTPIFRSLAGYCSGSVPIGWQLGLVVFRAVRMTYTVGLVRPSSSRQGCGIVRTDGLACAILPIAFLSMPLPQRLLPGLLLLPLLFALFLSLLRRRLLLLLPLGQGHSYYDTRLDYDVLRVVVAG